jgi:hypothetical protein
MSKTPTGEPSKNLTAEQAAKGYRLVRTKVLYGLGSYWLAEVVIIVFLRRTTAIVFGAVVLLVSLPLPWVLRALKRSYNDRVIGSSSRPDVGL